MWPFGGAQPAMRSWGFLKAARRPKKQRRRRAETASSKQLPTHPCGSECRARLDGASHDLLEAHSLWEVGQPADNALDEVLTATCAIPGGIFPALNTNHTGPRFGVPPSEERPA